MDSLADKLASQGYLTASGFCDYIRETKPILAISYPTLMRFIKEGKVKAINLGGQTRISKEEIERYLEQGEEGFTPSDPVLRLGSTNSNNEQ